MSLTLLDWRRRVARLYAEVRAEPDAAAAHEHWRRARDELLRTHPDSPVPQPQRAGYPGAPVAPYDPALRFEVTVDTGVPAKRMEVATGTDGITRFDRIGCAHLPGGGDLDVWWLAAYGGGLFVPVKTRPRGRPATAAAVTCSIRSRARISAATAGSSSTSTSPTTPPAPTTPPGRARWPRRGTPWRGRCWPGN
jgi:hypothetical protein